MIILGLGSNLGDRLTCLRQALRLIQTIPQLSVQQVSPIYISDALLPENAPVSWDKPYLNLALRCETTFSPYELLARTKDIEIQLGRLPGKRWGPRPVDIDILAWDDLLLYDGALHVPHEQLHLRPFALWPLADVAPNWIYPLPGPLHGKTAAEICAPWGSRYNGDAPLHARQIAQRIDTPELMGIINVTPDSFSDGGKNYDPTLALQTIEELVNAGASIIDIGAEATGPNANTHSSAEEWQRLEPVLKNILATRETWVIPAKISIDTRHVNVAKKALELGADWINDVSGLEDPAMRDLLATSQCDVVFMHHLGIPVNKNRVLPQDQDPVTLVYAWAEQRLQELIAAGIAKERLIFDVGIGYGKTAEQSLQLIQQITTFHKLDVRLLVGHSRKSFLTLFTNKPAPERDPETVAISLELAKHKVDYLRVHNVAAHSKSFSDSMERAKNNDLIAR